MPITASGLFVAQWIGGLTGLHVLNWDAESHKCALYTNTITPNFSDTLANTRYGAGAFSTGEITGPGYTAGGAVVTATTVTESPASIIMFDAADVVWPASTITNARGALIYADAITSPNADPGLVFINFGSDYSTNNGTFTIQWAATGIFTWDVY